ncbi:protein of unknown function [Thauera humireducens]|uniref:hypothetical protein n=1 Tax=Thauera humireducens TaxID=1134435 RepID=UPI002467A29F|nr:hypothetical protein [Thauera humireducens]CAH1748293.1 protein of unknown function [Thauera humireducens]
MSRLEQRLAKLEDGVRQDNTPISFELVFVSTDGKPVERFSMTDDGLVPMAAEADTVPSSGALTASC